MAFSIITNFLVLHPSVQAGLFSYCSAESVCDNVLDRLVWIIHHGHTEKRGKEGLYFEGKQSEGL